VLATAVVLAFACTLPVAEWDWSVLSESLALSSLAAIFAFAIRYARTNHQDDAVGIFLAAIAFILARDENIWTVALIGIATILGAWVIRRRARKMRDPIPQGSSARIVRRTAVLGVLLVVLAIVCEVPVITSQRDSQYIIDILVVRIFPFPDRVAWFSDHGMPEARTINQMASEVEATRGFARVIPVDLGNPEFGPLTRWINADGPATYALWLIEHPSYVVEAPFVEPPLTFNNANGDLSFYAAPGRFGTAALDWLLFPGFWGELAILALALFIATRRAVWRREFWAVAVLAALGPLAMLIAWQGEAQEVTRHMVVGSVETRLGLLLLLVMAILSPASPPSLPLPTVDNPEMEDPTSAPSPTGETQAI
jgi:hypothetical protein